MPGKKLLVADDSLTIQKVIRLALSNEGYEIQTVSDGDDAIQQISLFRPDVVLVDVSLPGQTAFDVKRAVNSHDELQDVKFVLMSSAFEKIDEEQLTELVFHGRLTKPFDPAHLRQVLNDVTADLKRPPAPAPTAPPPLPPSPPVAPPPIPRAAPVAPAPPVAPPAPHAPPPPIPPAAAATPPGIPPRPGLKPVPAAAPPAPPTPPPPTPPVSAAPPPPPQMAPPPLPQIPDFEHNEVSSPSLTGFSSDLEDEPTQELSGPDVESFLRPIAPDDTLAGDAPLPSPPPLPMAPPRAPQDPSTNPWSNSFSQDDDDPTSPVIPTPAPPPPPSGLASAPPASMGNNDGTDSDIKHLTESTIRMSGLDDFDWSVNEPSMKPPAAFADDPETSFPPLPRNVQGVRDEPRDTFPQASNFEESAFDQPPPPPELGVSHHHHGGAVSAPGPSADEIAEMVRKQVEETLSKMAQKMLPDVAEKIIKAEIHKMLSEQP